MRHWAILLGAAVALSAMLRPAAAEVFVLASGGRVEGELRNPDEKPRKNYVVKLATGGEITLDAAQVKQVINTRPELAEYEKVRPQYPDTAEGQWQLAEWCLEHRLPTQRKTHLQRVIELDPNHAQARASLGYTKTDGQWLTEKERMEGQGYRFYKGKWRLPQEIELIEGQRKKGLDQQAWFEKFKEWRKWFGTAKERQARKNIAAVEDPMAVKALAMGLRKDRNPDARLLYAEALGKIGTDDAAVELATCAIEDPVEEVRLTCLDYLQKKKNAGVVAYFVSKLRSKDNAVINRAAVGLSRMKDATAIPPLIDALISTHKAKIGNGNPGQMSMTFPTGGTGGGTGMGMNQQPKIISYQLQNQPVLDALITITGQNFAFNQRAWRTWYATQRKAEVLDARRN